MIKIVWKSLIKNENKKLVARKKNTIQLWWTRIATGLTLTSTMCIIWETTFFDDHQFVYFFKNVHVLVFFSNALFWFELTRERERERERGGVKITSGSVFASFDHVTRSHRRCKQRSEISNIYFLLFYSHSSIVLSLFIGKKNLNWIKFK